MDRTDKKESPVMTLIRNRRSLRTFDTRPVVRETIMECVEAARLAPSADNVQPWRFLILDDPEIISSFCDTVFTGVYRATRWAERAPVLIVLLADLNMMAHRVAKIVQKIPFYYLDIGIAGEHFVLRAQELGLGCCWIGWFNVKRAAKFLKIPSGMRICELMALGYPPPEWSPKPKKRKTIEEIVFFNHLGKK
jgi:nitroreductase